MATAVYVEVGQKRVFACALDWPGWCRSGRDEALALEVLAASAPRYAVVAHDAGLAFTPHAADGFEVREHLPGNGTTDFGAPDKAATSDSAPLSIEEAARIAKLTTASWRLFDRVVARAPAELAKGPRGGGRDRDKIARHLLASETAYARQIGVRHRQPALDDAGAVAAHRAAILDAIRGSHAPSHISAWRWLPRYAARRIAWHVLDHAWEIEDKGGLVPERAWQSD